MRKLPQLSLRDLFWLVALVAMGCGWWVRERQLRAELKVLTEKEKAATKRAEDLAYRIWSYSLKVDLGDPYK